MSESSQRPRVGFIGLGVMGTPMAGHLIDAGYEVTVFDVERRATDRFAGFRPAGRVAEGLADLGRASDVVITMLPDGAVVCDVVTGGLGDGLTAGALVVDCSSSQPWLTLETAAALAERGVAMIDAPVSGAQWGAEAAELVFMVGGEAADVERARPLLDVLGRAVFHLGPLASGHTMKCINNTVTAMTLQATLEGLALGVAAGLDPAVINDVFNESTAGSWITRTHIEQRILSRTFDDPFRLALMLKDIDIANRLAERLELELPLAALCQSSYREADQQAGASASLSDIGRWVEARTGVTIGG